MWKGFGGSKLFFRTETWNFKLGFTASFHDVKKNSYAQNRSVFWAVSQPSNSLSALTNTRHCCELPAAVGFRQTRCNPGSTLLPWAWTRSWHGLDAGDSPASSTRGGSGPFSLGRISKHPSFFSLLTAHNSCLVQASNKHWLLYAGTSVIVKEVFSQTIPLNKIFSPTDVVWQFFIFFHSNLNF